MIYLRSQLYVNIAVAYTKSFQFPPDIVDGSKEAEIMFVSTGIVLGMGSTNEMMLHCSFVSFTELIPRMILCCIMGINIGVLRPYFWQYVYHLLNHEILKQRSMWMLDLMKTFLSLCIIFAFSESIFLCSGLIWAQDSADSSFSPQIVS